MKRLLASTAILVAASAPLMAQTAVTVSPFSQIFSEGDVYGTELIGQDLYVGDAPMTTGDLVNAQMRGEWENVGNIDDLLISQEGEVKAVLLDIGGFLGIGARTIAVDMAELRFLGDETDPDDVFVTINSTREALENAPAFEHVERPGGVTQTGAAGTAAPETTAATTEGATTVVPIIPEGAVESDGAEVGATTDETGEGREAAPMDSALLLTRPEVMPEGYAPLEPQALTGEMLTGAPVYGAAEEEIGEISELMVDGSGNLAGAVIDVGGFLGLGARPVAVSFEEMQIVQSADDDMRVYIEAAREKLEQRPVYGE